MIIDSHSHIYDSQFDDDRDLVVQRAKQAGVGHIILPNENLASLPRLIDASHRYGDYVSLAIGLHPEEVRDDYADVLQAMYSLLDDHPWVAVGEIGIDLYWEKNWRRQQMEVLDYQLRWCVERGLPFIMHCRDGLNEIIDVLENFGEPLPAGVFHCFQGSAADVERLRSYGDFFFGVNGVATFKRNTVVDLLPVIGLDRILLETDAPYLAPVPYRGKRNESAFLPAVAKQVAAVLGVTLNEVQKVTSRNACDLFGLQVNIDKQ